MLAFFEGETTYWLGSDLYQAQSAVPLAAVEKVRNAT